MSSRATFVSELRARTEKYVIAAGEIVLLPRNDLRIDGQRPEPAPVAGRDVIHPPKDGGLFIPIHHGGTGRCTRMVCGFLGCDSAKGNPVISTLPPVLNFNVSKGETAESIRSTFGYSGGGFNWPSRIGELYRQSFRSCYSWRRCGVTRRPYRTVRPDGSPVCATLTLRKH